MPISFVQSKSVTNPSPAELAFNLDNTAHNLLIIVARILSIVSVTLTCSDSAGNVVESLSANFNAAAGTVSQTFIVHNCKPGPNTVTIGGGTIFYIAIHEFSGVNSTDQSAVAMGAGLSQDSGPITTTHADELLFGYEDTGVQASVTGAPTWTTAEFSNIMFLTQYKIVSSIGTYNSTTTATAGKSGVVNWTEEIISFYYVPPVSPTTQIITF